MVRGLLHVREGLRISALAKKTGVRSTTLRYWEQLGRLPRAGHAHTGYRLSGDGAVQYVEFIRKSKTMGLSLRPMKRVLAPFFDLRLSAILRAIRERANARQAASMLQSLTCPS